MSSTKPTSRIRLAVDSGRPGPLVLLLSAVHGNEPAGVAALDQLAAAAEADRFGLLCGRVYGFIGNMQALSQNRRYLSYDLNRSFNTSRIQMLRERDDLIHEDVELLAILDLVEPLLRQPAITEVVLLDLHTTSSAGADFTFVGAERESRELAMQFEPTLVLGLLDSLSHTSLHYFTSAQLGCAYPLLRL